jgi:hypothetical protein
MVKTRTLVAAALAAACAAALSGCAVRGPFVTLTVESVELSQGPAAPFLSLAVASGELYAVFADRATTTLDLVTVPEGPHLPPASLPPEIIDKVDVVAPLFPAFGEHVLSVEDGTVAVLYLDRETDQKNVLKLARRKLGSQLVVLGHHYQREDIIQFADVRGDSFKLACWAAQHPEAEHIVIWDQAGFHPKPEIHTVPNRVHLVALPPYSPELNPVEAIGDLIKDRIGNVLWNRFADLERAISEELRPLYESADAVRRLVSHPWLIEQANATAA